MNWKKVAQLALVHVGVTITVVPITGTLNRIMIADLHLSALLVGILVAFPYLLSPLQVIMGNWADSNPLWGRHRSPWMVIGGLMAAFGGYLAPHAVFLLAENFAVGLVLALLTFTVWGVGVNIASVSYLSLVSELSIADPRWRNRSISVMWTTMIIFIIVTSIVLSRMLDPYSRAALYTAFGAVWMVACCLILVGASGIEPASKAGQRAKHTADNPLTAFRLLTDNPSARRFFIYLLVVLASFYAQDVVLEPYGAQILNMSVAMTTRLTTVWGTGLLITLIGGLVIVRVIGKKHSANLSAVIAAIAFIFIIVAGIMHDQRIFMGAVLLLGLGNGLMTMSNLSFMLDMSIPQAAGLYMGAWGVANFAGRAIATIGSGFLRDSIHHATSNLLASYVTIFGLEALGLLITIWLFRKISVAEFQRDANLRIQEVLALAGD